MSIYAFGEPVVLTLKKSDGTTATLSDYSTVTLHIPKPDGTTETHAGAVTYTFLPTAAGTYKPYWTTTGPTGATFAEPFEVQAAGAAALVSLEDVKAETNITATTDDAELRGYILAASAVLLNHPDYRVADVCQVQTYTDEEHDGGSDLIVLDHYPVTDVDTVTEYTPTAQPIAAEPLGGAYTGYGYRLKAASGILTRTSGGSMSRWCGTVLVTYTAGSAAVPAEIRLAALALVDHLWEMQRGGEGQGLPSGDEFTSPDSFGTPFAPSVALPPVVKGLLAAYARTPAVA